MSRLPVPGKDAGSWGAILNEYLSVEHNGDGTLKNVARPADINALDARYDAKYARTMGWIVVTDAQ